MNVKLIEEHENLIRNIALKEGFSEFKIEALKGSVKGDGYLGVITTVDVKDDRNNLHLILKTAHKHEVVRKQTPIRSAYLREMYIYETIFPIFNKFQIENGLFDGFSAYVKIYGSSDNDINECLVFENLREIGYKMWNRKVPMNSDHVSLVVAEYGKFHAVSLAMKIKKPEEYKKLTENLEDIFKETQTEEGNEKFYNYIQESSLKAVKGNDFATEAIKRFCKDLPTFLGSDLQIHEDQLVLTHGDCWCNNIMFKYEDILNITKPTKVCLLDWQLAKRGSPVLDLAYFLFTCSPKEILTDFKTYLKIYHESLSESLRKMSCDVESVLPYSLLEYHWKKYSKYGLFVALMLVRLMLSDSDEVPDIVESAEAGNDFLDDFYYDPVNVNEYNQRIIDIVTILAENKLM